MEGIGKSKPNITRRLARLENRLAEHERREDKTVVSPETVRALDAFAQIRREGTWDPHDVESWSWRTRESLGERLRDLLVDKGVGEALATNMGAHVANNAFDKLAARETQETQSTETQSTTGGHDAEEE